MDSYVKAITLDVNADENYTIIKAKQGDKINRKIAITLKKDGANFTPTGVSQIWFRIQKPDNNIAIVKSTDSGSPISTAGNVYTVTLSEQCLTAAGKAWCDLAFLDSSGNTLSSCAFILNIIPMPNGDTARSSSAWTDLQQAIDDAERFAAILAFRTSGNYIQYTVNGTTWNNLCTVGAIGGDLQTQIDALNGALNSLESSKAVRYDAAQSLTAAQKIQVFSNIFGANNNAGFHNSFFRGKSLGTSFTTAQHNAISAGTFDDMFIGDYWTIGGIDYVICHFDYYYRCSDSDINYHHIVVMPRGVMTGLSVTKTSAETSDGYYQWNETNTTSGGYIASRMRTVIMPACDTKVKAAFGSSYVKTISELYPNGHDASTGRANGWAWTSTDLACDLCNETMVYGAQVWSISNDGRPGYEVGIDKWQLAIFRLYPAFANIRAYWWLRSVSSAAFAAFVSGYGFADSYCGASYALGVRPRFLVS